jgi:hypothetical protein
MLSSAPFIAELPQDLAGKTASLVTVHGRYGNNALNGDWELGITSNTSAPPQQQSQRTWKSGTPEPFTFAITKIPASLTAPAATSGDFTIGGSNLKASYTDIASYEPNAIKTWARSTTTGSGVTIKDLKIKTPGVPGETVFPGTVINVSQDVGPVFQEIIIAGIDYTGLPLATGGRSITIPANATTASVAVFPILDTEIEYDETVVLTLLPGAGYGLGTRTVATGTILDDDYFLDLVLDGLPEESAPPPNELSPGALLPIGGQHRCL